MSDDNKQYEDDQFGINGSDSNTDSQSNTNNGEETHDDLSNEDKAKIAEANRNKQIQVWYNRVLNGEITIEQIPANLGWVKSAVQTRLGTQSESTEEVVKKLLEQERNQEKYNSLMSTLKAQATDTEVELVKGRYETLIASGIKDKALALETAMAACGVTPKTIKDIRREGMTMPTASYYDKPKEAEKITKDASWDDLAGVSQLDPKSRSEYYSKLI